jgi:hypothetical protein
LCASFEPFPGLFSLCVGSVRGLGGVGSCERDGGSSKNDVKLQGSRKFAVNLNFEVETGIDFGRSMMSHYRKLSN